MTDLFDLGQLAATIPFPIDSQAATRSDTPDWESTTFTMSGNPTRC